MKIVSVVGARPNFMKVAPFCRALKAYPEVQHILVHTGQHYDVRMSEQFFKELDIPNPDINLEIGSGTHAEQVGRTMIAFEKVLKAEKPDWVVVLGDVNATCACSITAKKEHIKCAHIEAGLRSRDMDMKFVGNIMIDTLEREREKAAALDINVIAKENLIDEIAGRELPVLGERGYVAMTMHRPSNVDQAETLVPAMRFFLDEVSKDYPIVWAIHPRAQKMLKEFGLWDEVVANENMILVKPLGYHAMLRLNMGARLFMTDSGGLQEECCVLGTPCLTMRWNTERPITLMENGGASILVGNAVEKIREAYKSQIDAARRPMRPELWDGHTADRIAECIVKGI